MRPFRCRLTLTGGAAAKVVGFALIAEEFADLVVEEPSHPTLDQLAASDDLEPSHRRHPCRPFHPSAEFGVVAVDQHLAIVFQFAACIEQKNCQVALAELVIAAVALAVLAEVDHLASHRPSYLKDQKTMMGFQQKAD